MCRCTTGYRIYIFIRFDIFKYFSMMSLQRKSFRKLSEHRVKKIDVYSLFIFLFSVTQLHAESLIRTTKTNFPRSKPRFSSLRYKGRRMRGFTKPWFLREYRNDYYCRVRSPWWVARTMTPPHEAMYYIIVRTVHTTYTYYNIILTIHTCLPLHRLWWRLLFYNFIKISRSPVTI